MKEKERKKQPKKVRWSKGRLLRKVVLMVMSWRFSAPAIAIVEVLVETTTWANDLVAETRAAGFQVAKEVMGPQWKLPRKCLS